MLKKKNEENEFKPIVFVNNPIDKPEEDIIGFKSQIDTLESAIDEGANMIGIIADYGTGKSSLTDNLMVHLRKSKKATKPIKINLWDCLTKIQNNEKDEKVSALTRSFLHQLSSGHNYKFGSFINKLLSKNYGNISVGINSAKFWWMFIVSGLIFVIYKIVADSNVTIMEFLPDKFKDIVSYIIAGSPILLFVSIVFLILGIKDTYIAFSHWKMQNQRELEINDVFDVYTTIIKKIKPICKKKRIIIIEDLDRIVDKVIIVEFLKELYRFHDSLGEDREKFVFIVSIKPESLLKDDPQIEDKRIYTKLFDVMLSLKPIHFDDYDALLLKLLNNNPKQRKDFEKLTGITIQDPLPEVFKWIKKGENLTLRDLKDRLNHATAIMLSIKSKNYKIKTAVMFEGCAAVAYFESRYPSLYFKLIKDESNFAKFMKSTPEILNTNSKEVDVQSLLVNSFDEIFGNTNNKAYDKTFVEEFCGLIANGIFNDDFRMYFYTYPKGSHIKTTDERALCNYLIFPNIYKDYDDLDELVGNVFYNGENSIIENTLRSLNAFPKVVLENQLLLAVASNVSLQKTFEVFSKEIIDSTYDENYNADFWLRLSLLDNNSYQSFKELVVKRICNASKTTDEIIKIRKAIILGLKSNIVDFVALFDSKNNMPIITKEEIDLINNIKFSLKFLTVNKFTNSDTKYIVPLIIDKPISDNEDLHRAIDILKRILTITTPDEMGEVLLTFVNTNAIIDDEFFEAICKSKVNKTKIASYLNHFLPASLSVRYKELIDSLGFETDLSWEIVKVLLADNYYYTPLLMCANSNDFTHFKFERDNCDKILEECNRINENAPEYIVSIRNYLYRQCNYNEFDKLYFSPYNLISESEFLKITKANSFRLVDTSQISNNNCKSVSHMLSQKAYSIEETVELFDWLFNDDNNSDCLSEPITKKECFDNLDLEAIGVKRLNSQERDYIYNLISDICTINTPQSMIEIMTKFRCLIPELEKQIQTGSNIDVLYSNFIASVNEFTDETLKWLEKHYIRCGLSKELCDILYENNDFQNYIIATTLRENKMILQQEIPFDNYQDVYLSVEEMYDIMSDHWEFLETLQDCLDFEKVDMKYIIPMFKAKQTARLFEYIFSDKVDKPIKEVYLREFGYFKEEKDSKSFQILMCKEENMELLGDYKLYDKIHERLWSSNRSHKMLFTKAWNQKWSKVLKDKEMQYL